MQQLGGGAGVHPFQPSLASDPLLCRAGASLALRKATDSRVRVPGLAGPALPEHSQLSGADAWKDPLRMRLGTCRWHQAAWPASPRAPAPSMQSRTEPCPLPCTWQPSLPAPGGAELLGKNIRKAQAAPLGDEHREWPCEFGDVGIPVPGDSPSPARPAPRGRPAGRRSQRASSSGCPAPRTS